MPTVIDGTLGIDTVQDNVITTADLQNGAVTPAKLSQPMTLMTAQNTTSGTSINFTSIPSWVKRITVMLNGVSTNGTAHMRVRIGSGSLQVTGYVSLSLVTNDSNTTGGTTDTTGFVMFSNVAANTLTGHMILTLVGSNVWVASYQTRNSALQIGGGGGNVTLAGALDVLSLVSTDTFDLGSVNLLLEG